MNHHCRKLLGRLRALYPREARHLVCVRSIARGRVAVCAPFDGDWSEAAPLVFGWPRSLVLRGAIQRRRIEVGQAGTLLQMFQFGAPMVREAALQNLLLGGARA